MAGRNALPHLNACPTYGIARRRASVTSASINSSPRRTVTFTLSPGLCCRSAFEIFQHGDLVVAEFDQHVAPFNTRFVGGRAFEHRFEQDAVFHGIGIGRHAAERRPIAFGRAGDAFDAANFDVVRPRFGGIGRPHDIDENSAIRRMPAMFSFSTSSLGR